MRQPSLFDTPPRREPMAPASNNTTSLAAAKAIRPHRAKQREDVFKVYARPEGGTDDEVRAITEIVPDSIRPRRRELIEANRVVDSGETRLTQSGRRAIVWRAVK
jgi:hypothetical protein